jgi:hypothetical protein
MDPSGFLKGNERATVTARIESASEVRLLSVDQSSLQSGCNTRWLLFSVYPSKGSGKTHASDTGVFMNTLAMNTSSDLHLRNTECEERLDGMFGMLNMNDSETVFCSRYTILHQKIKTEFSSNPSFRSQTARRQHQYGTTHCLVILDTECGKKPMQRR